MIDRPRIGYADKAHGASLHTPPRTIPIILVPGIMGTRLTDPKTDKLAWNPVGLPIGDGPKAFAVDYARLTQVSADLVPDETHGWEKDDPEYAKTARIRHYSNLVPDFYGDLAKDLDAINNTLAQGLTGLAGFRVRVYCCGYDWRQDNAKSALRLAAVVDEALRETRERKVIIVAHSMGGLVSRYYCRALGGESKVFRLFLLGSPTLGAPEAYGQLKHGLSGLYIKDFLEDTDPKDRMVEGISEGAMMEKLVTDWVASGKASGVAGAAKSALGLWLALCLGAGRWLRRKETVYFARQLPSIYQLLPTSLYCRDHHNWLLFDPLATGHAPTGFMLVFPTLFDILMAPVETIATLADPHRKMGDKIKKAVQGFLAPEEAERTSKLATAMRDTLEERFTKIGKLLGDDPDKPRFGQHADSGAANVLNGLKSLAEVFIRIEKSFLDCRSNRTLYDDIYTGFLDLPELRAISAANLALAYRFDEALTVDPYPVGPATPLMTLLKGALLPIVDKISAPSIANLAAGKDNFIHKLTNKAETDVHKEEEKQKKARAYMHPATVNIYGTTEIGDSGGLLFPTDILSNFDSNIVRWILLPSAIIAPFALALGAASDHSTGFLSQEFGDGVVPVASGNPDAEALSAKFLETKTIEHAQHNALGKAADVRVFLQTKIMACAMDFLLT
jgi:pimeloyl-ACP methyl ester carboxylesterase